MAVSARPLALGLLLALATACGGGSGTAGEDAGADERAVAPDAGAPEDAATLDAEATDAEAEDAARLDAEATDAEAEDAGPADAEPRDAGALDAETADAGSPDAHPDAGASDAEATDASPADAGPPPTPSLTQQPAGPVVLDEGGRAALLVGLDGPALGPVPVTIDVAPAGALTLSPASFVLTATASGPRVVQLRAPADVDAQDAQATLTISAPDRPDLTCAVTIVDRDRPRLVLDPPALSLVEGTSASVTVRLDRAPETPVTVTVRAAGPVQPAPTTVVIAPASFDAPRTIDVSALEDADAAPASASITLQATGLGDVMAPVVIVDDDHLALEVTPPALVLAEGETAQVNVRLTAQPLAPLEVRLSTTAPGLSAVTPTTLSFDPSSWSTPQTVHLAAARDADLADAHPVVRLRAPGLPEARVDALVRDAPVCGDGLAQGAEACDGADLRGATCRGVGFSGGALACSPSCALSFAGCYAGPDLCGDGVVSGAEECDGASDATCPGRCSRHCACPSAPATGQLEVHVLDVDQGDAILVISPDGFTMLVDAGTEPNASAVTGFLATRGLGLDYTVVSHMDADHVGGMDAVLRAHPEVVAAFDHGGWVGSAAYVEYDLVAGARRIAVSAGETLDLGPSLAVDVLHAHDGAPDENDNSVVLRLTHGAIRILLGGDCEAGCEAAFDPGPVEIYKVHHHGSRTSSTEALLTRMDPYTALVSAGLSNVYGHPHAEVLARLAAHQAEIYGTWNRGSLAVVSDGSAYTVAGEAVCELGELRTCGASTVGACQLGHRACSAGMWASCQGAIEPRTEICGNGADDDCDGSPDALDADCATVASTVLLDQVFYDTPGVDSAEEMIALYNPTAQPILLDGYALGDPQSTWTIPPGHTIAPGAHLCIAKDAAGFAALFGRSPDVAGLTLSLGNSGDALTLFAPGAVPIDYVAWGNQDPAWPLLAPTGDALVRQTSGLDSDTPGDWRTEHPAAPRCAP